VKASGRHWRVEVPGVGGGRDARRAARDPKPLGLAPRWQGEIAPAKPADRIDGPLASFSASRCMKPMQTGHPRRSKRDRFSRSAVGQRELIIGRFAQTGKTAIPPSTTILNQKGDDVVCASNWRSVRKFSTRWPTWGRWLRERGALDYTELVLCVWRNFVRHLQYLLAPLLIHLALAWIAEYVS